MTRYTIYEWGGVVTRYLSPDIEVVDTRPSTVLCISNNLETLVEGEDYEW